MTDQTALAHPAAAPDPVVARALAPVGGDPLEDDFREDDPAKIHPLDDAGPPEAPPCEDPPLTPRQEAFADAYARTPNGAAAAREAGYAAASAKVAASRNLRRSGVLLRIMARRHEQAVAREAHRARIAGILEEALTMARSRENPHALARIAGLMMRLEGLHAIDPADDRLLADATEDQLHELLACYEIAAGCADPEVPDPNSADVDELAERAFELMHAARSKVRDLPGARAADSYLSGLIDHLDRGVENALEACTFARMLDEAAEDGLSDPSGRRYPSPLGERDQG